MIPAFCALLGVNKDADGSQYIFIDSNAQKVYYQRYSGSALVINQEVTMTNPAYFPEQAIFTNVGNVVIMANKVFRTFFRVKHDGIHFEDSYVDAENFERLIGMDVNAGADPNRQDTFVLGQNPGANTFKLLRYETKGSSSGTIMLTKQVVFSQRSYADPSKVTGFFVARAEEVGPVITYDKRIELINRTASTTNQIVPATPGTQFMDTAAIPNTGANYMVTYGEGLSSWLAYRGPMTNAYNQFKNMSTWTPDPGSVWGRFFPEQIYSNLIAVTSRHVSSFKLDENNEPVLGKEIDFQEQNPSFGYDYLKSSQSSDRRLIVIPITRNSDSKKGLAAFSTTGGSINKARVGNIMHSLDYTFLCSSLISPDRLIT